MNPPVKRSSPVLCLLVSAALLAFGSFSGCQSTGSAWSSGGGKSVSSAAASGASAARGSGQADNSSIVSASDTGAVSAQDSAATYVNADYEAMLSAIRLQATGNTHYDQINPLTSKCISVALSYDDGIYDAMFPQKYTAMLYKGRGGFYVSPTKTAAVLEKSDSLVVVYSNDRGKTWEESTPISPSDVPFRNNNTKPGTIAQRGGFLNNLENVDIDFPTDDCGYLLLAGHTEMNIQYDRVLFKTTDGGKTWRFVQPPLKVNSYGSWIDQNRNSSQTEPPYYIVTCASNTNNITFINSDIGFLSGSYSPYGVLPLYRTSDGGVTCSKIFLPKIPNINGTGDLLFPYFKNRKGYLPTVFMDSVYYYTSTDEGITWIYDPSMDNSYKKYLKK